eukprot:2780721-Heterocapsa_arctica.AAC.1
MECAALQPSAPRGRSDRETGILSATDIILRSQQGGQEYFIQCTRGATLQAGERAITGPRKQRKAFTRPRSAAEGSAVREGSSQRRAPPIQIEGRL